MWIVILLLGLVVSPRPAAAEKQSFIHHQFVTVHVDPQGWVLLEHISDVAHITSIVWHKNVQTILVPNDAQIVYAYYPDNPDNCVCNATACTVRLNTHAAPHEFWTHSKAFVLITKQDEHTNVFEVITLTDADGCATTTTAATTTTTTSATEESTTTTTVETTVQDTLSPSSLPPPPGAEGTDPPSSPPAEPGGTEPPSSLPPPPGEEGTDPPSSPPPEAGGTEPPSGGTEPPSPPSGAEGTDPPSSPPPEAPSAPEAGGAEPHAFGGEQKATDAKSEVSGATNGHIKAHLNVAIIALSVFGVFVLIMVILVALKGNNDGEKEKADDDIYVGGGSYEWTGGVKQEHEPDTREKDLLIMQSLGKGADPEFQANM